MRCANFSTVEITRAKAIQRVRFKAEMSLGKQISPAKRSMNIHEKNALRSRALCAIGSRDSAIFIFPGRGHRQGRRGRDRALDFSSSALGKNG